MDVDSATDRRTSIDTSQTQVLMNEAKRLVEQDIYPSWTQAGNVWRSAWAMDTLIDYYLLSGSDSSPFRRDAITALDPTALGNWWDDFGWIGIAALRMVESGLAGGDQATFLKIAINAWAYMNGPGWARDINERRIYPFFDVQGWGTDGFAGNDRSNIGAPNVWARIDQTWPSRPEAWKRQVHPRFTPGGAWNSPITNDCPIPVAELQTYGSVYLNPVQNTVTNGLFTLLSLRLLKAAGNPAYATVFNQSGLAVNACRQAWMNQSEWLEKWTSPELPPLQSLLMPLRNGALVRERVSTFLPINDSVSWDAAYRSDLIWTGDQGLLLGALRESRSSVLPPYSPLLDLWPSLIRGVFANTFLKRDYGRGNTLSGAFPVPWWVAGSNAPFDAPAPGGDVWDYRTGVGVFMRYALQAFRAEPESLSPYAADVISAAKLIAQPGFGDEVNPGGACDALRPPSNGEEPANAMIPYVNRLSVLLLAAAMSG